MTGVSIERVDNDSVSAPTGPSTGSGVSLRAVTVAHNGHTVLGPIDLDVAASSWLCLIGPNGAGKTSLLHAIAGLASHGGSVHVAGQTLEDLTAPRRARLVALVPQNPTIPLELTVTEYVLLGRTPHIPRFGIESAHDHEVTASVIERLDLGAFAVRLLGQLSGGELQRVVLARALAQQTPVLLLDEPTTALDLGHQQQVLGLIDELRADYALTVVTTMHDLTLAGAYADTLVLLDRGTAVATGEASVVLTEEMLGRYYRAAVQVVTAPDGTLAVLPVRADRRAPIPDAAGTNAPIPADG
jgi:iron complex transport system ATP-binding protein